MIKSKEEVINDIISLILEELEEKDRGNLTSTYAIRLLKETIARIEATALMSPLRNSIKD